MRVSGAMMVGRCGSLLEITIPSLLSFCDDIVVLTDHPDNTTMSILSSLESEYRDRIKFIPTNVPPAKNDSELKRRFDKFQNKIRQNIPSYFDSLKDSDRPDVLIWPDSDEILTEYFRPFLDEFIDSDRTSIEFNHAEPFVDFFHLRKSSITPHFRVFKYCPGLKPVYGTRRRLRPLTGVDSVRVNYMSLHLASYKDRWLWRRKNWRDIVRPNTVIWKLDKDLREMSPEEIAVVYALPHSCLATDISNDA